MMNKKGFTLIELLAVIVILSSVSLIVIASISSSLGRRDEKECQEQIELAKNAAKIYFSLNGGTTVKISVLKSGDYFNQDNKTYKLTNNDVVTFDGSKYIFTGKGECK